MNGPRNLSLLYTDYGRFHFLINPEQAPASVYAEHPEPWDSGYAYFDDKLAIEGGEAVPLFSLHDYLTDLFRLSRETQAFLVLLVPLSCFEKSIRKSLRAGPLKGEPGAHINSFRLGVRISSETAIRKVPLGEMAPHSGLLRRRLSRAGLLAVHFSGESMGLLVDLGRAAAASLNAADTGEAP